MGGEEMTDSSFVMENDVEDELDFCMEVEQSPAGQVSVGSDEWADREDWDWNVMREHLVSPASSQEQREGSPGGHGGSQTQGNSGTEAYTGSVDNGEKEAEREVCDQTEESKEKKMEGAFDVCLWPIEESGGHVRITLEEVERYYRFSRCCHWLCGRCQVFYCCFSCFLSLCHIMIVIFSVFHLSDVQCFFLYHLCYLNNTSSSRPLHLSLFTSCVLWDLVYTVHVLTVINSDTYNSIQFYFNPFLKNQQTMKVISRHFILYLQYSTDLYSDRTLN